MDRVKWLVINNGKFIFCLIEKFVFSFIEDSIDWQLLPLWVKLLFDFCGTHSFVAINLSSTGCNRRTAETTTNAAARR